MTVLPERWGIAFRRKSFRDDQDLLSIAVVDGERLAVHTDGHQRRPAVVIPERRGRIREYVEEYPNAKYFEGTGVWKVPVDVALPCATQNELHGDDAEALVKNGCICIAEGANMPSTPEAIEKIQEAGILYGPGKAANAGGVAVSGLEMSQNSMRLSWTREEVDERLHGIMCSIHEACTSTADEYGQPGNYVLGANIAGFIKVADSMLDQGVV